MEILQNIAMLISSIALLNSTHSMWQMHKRIENLKDSLELERINKKNLKEENERLADLIKKLADREGEEA